MLTQLSTVKARLGINDFDPTNDALLTNAIRAISARFDKECNRSFARTVNVTHEFPAGDCEIVPLCYPIESVSKFETKASETGGWVERTVIDFLIRRACVISLACPLSELSSERSIGRVTYTGGYVLPGA